MRFFQRSFRPPSARQGFTLVEAVLAMGVMVVLLAASQSLVFLTAKALPSGRTAAYVGLTSAIALDALEADLRAATLVTVATATNLELRVPDRDNDGLQETIRYQWSGVAGAAFLRKVTLSQSGSTSTESLVPGLATFAFSHDLLAPSAFRPSELPETLLASFEPTATLTANAIATNAMICQTISPVLPPTAVTYRITRIALRLAANGPATGKTAVTINQPLLGVVSLTSLATATVSEDTLATSATWVDFALPSPPTISVVVPTAITLKVSSSGPCAFADVLTSGAPAGAGAMSRSSTGIIWNASSGNAAAHRVYGTFATVATPLAANASRYAGCTLKFTTQGSVGSATELSYRCPNLPEAP